MPRQTIFTPASKRGVVLPGLPSDHTYKFEVQAYRKVDKDISATGVILSTTALTSVGYKPTVTPNFTGDIHGRASLQVVQNLEAIASDGVLSTTEKPGTIIAYNQVKSQHDALRAKSIAMNAYQAQRDAAQTAMTALTNYLAGLTPAWNDTTVHTPINAASFQAAWASLYVKVADLDAAITGQPGADAPKLLIQYSVDGVTGWHSTWVTGDLFQRTSNDNGATWSAASRFVGTDGTLAWSPVFNPAKYRRDGSDFAKLTLEWGALVTSPEPAVGASISFTVTDLVNHRILGLQGTTNQILLYLTDANLMVAYTGSGFIGQNRTAAANDVLTVRHVGNRLVAYQNGVEFTSQPCGVDERFTASLEVLEPVTTKSLTYSVTGPKGDTGATGPTLEIRAPKTVFDSLDGVLLPNQTLVATAFVNGVQTSVGWNATIPSGASVKSAVGSTFSLSSTEIGLNREIELVATYNGIPVSGNFVVKDEMSSATRTTISDAVADTNASKAAVADLADTGVITKTEKKILLREWQEIQSEKALIEGKADAFGFSNAAGSPRNNHAVKYDALANYMNSGSPSLLSSSTGKTNIDRAIYHARFNEYYDARLVLANELTTYASTVATWDGVSTSGGKKPADNAGTTLDLISGGNSLIVIQGNTVSCSGAEDWNLGKFARTKEHYDGPVYVAGTMGAGQHGFIGFSNNPGLGGTSYLDSEGGYYAFHKSSAGPGNIHTVAGGPWSTNVFHPGLNSRTFFMVINDGVNVRFYADGDLIRTVPAPAHTRNFGRFAMAGPSKMTGLQFGPFNDAAWARIQGAGRPADNAGTTLRFTPMIGNPAIEGNTIRNVSSESHTGVRTTYSLNGNARAEFRVPHGTHVHAFLSTNPNHNEFSADSFGIGFGFSAGNWHWLNPGANAGANGELGSFEIMGSHNGGLNDAWLIEYNGKSVTASVNNFGLSKSIAVPAGKKVYLKIYVFDTVSAAPGTRYVSDIQFFETDNIDRTFMIDANTGRVDDPSHYNTQLIVGATTWANLQPSYIDRGTYYEVSLPAHNRAVASKTGPRTVGYGGYSFTLGYNEYWHAAVDDAALAGGSPTIMKLPLTADLLWPNRYHLASGRAPAAAGGGGGNTDWEPENCVEATSHMPDGRRAFEYVAGDPIRVLDEHFMDRPTTIDVHDNWLADAECVRLTSSSGISLIAAKSTPVTLRDGSVESIMQAKGKQLPVEDEDGFRWEEILDVEDVGVRTVAHIVCHQRTYAAGEQDGRFIYTHNPFHFNKP